MNIIKNIIKYLLFMIPCTIYKGLSLIIFDKLEIDEIMLSIKKVKKNKDISLKKALANYLDNCYRQVNGDI